MVADLQPPHELERPKRPHSDVSVSVGAVKPGRRDCQSKPRIGMAIKSSLMLPSHTMISPLSDPLITRPCRIIAVLTSLVCTVTPATQSARLH